MQHDEDAARRAMVDEINRHFRATSRVTGLSRMSDRLRDALLRVPRHRFVPEAIETLAYADSALHIGHGQTISQPFIVALMIELAAIDRGMRVLEVGTGSGYEAAVLAELGTEVYSIEIVRELADRAAEALLATGYGAVQLRCGDGYLGWPDAAPFDAILVTACAEDVPEEVVAQLRPGGMLVVPVGVARGHQELQVHSKSMDGEVTVAHCLPVAFVPLVHEEAAAVRETPLRA